MSDLSNTQFSPRLGIKLESVRLTTGLSQGKFADFLGYSHRGYINYERNVRDTPTALIQVLYSKLGIDPAWLLLGEGNRPQKLSLRKVDPALLAEVSQTMETWLSEHKGPIDSMKKAQIVSLAYDLCVSEEARPSAVISNLAIAVA